MALDPHPDVRYRDDGGRGHDTQGMVECGCGEMVYLPDRGHGDVEDEVVLVETSNIDLMTCLEK